MCNLMYKIVSSDIRIDELKLKRIQLCKEHLLETKPSIIHIHELESWRFKLKNLEDKQEVTLKKLQDSYMELENFLK